MVVTFGRRLALAAARHIDKDKMLNIYEELNRQCKLRFGISHISKWAAKSLQLLPSSAEAPTAESSTSGSFSETPLHGVDQPRLLYSHPKLYYQLAVFIDSSLSGGKSCFSEKAPMVMRSPRSISGHFEFVPDPLQTVAVWPYLPQPSLSSSPIPHASNTASHIRSDYKIGQVVITMTDKLEHTGSLRPEGAVGGNVGSDPRIDILEIFLDVENTAEKNSDTEHDEESVNAAGTETIWDQIGLFGA
ncbi:hypothetical protein NLG97_g7728 [Lecanicillium saksenae]|nr:hypothetical protein NLG97_g7728 [Lecanicillium saksenae]